MDIVVCPVLHEYVAPPDALSVALLPKQSGALPEMETTGIIFGFAVTGLLTALVHVPAV